jgi:hypothetical protein
MSLMGHLLEWLACACFTTTTDEQTAQVGRSGEMMTSLLSKFETKHLQRLRCCFCLSLDLICMEIEGMVQYELGSPLFL